ncbi:hypothetical protein [Oceanicoccus sagamiensis]|uniref:Uncharacterized protein n=1 Tax=Oceanicoccus sagamiensis TaxID=716816 RepID=A0A1X9NBL9_9GAMM|nr:hypothetical protein [Oceanicoccus sagamiensis]ARN74561.1 hypothetical protein BST96_10775 [Oceanicoccus sagamiensis]
MLRVSLLMSVMVLALWGCQAPPDLKKLQDENGALEQQLGQANRDISKLKADKVLLQQDVAELNRVVSVLGQEKNSRVTESTNLRGEVRQFVQARIDSLKTFLLASDLLDYIGGELVERSNVDKQPLLLVDLYNKVPRNGTLTGVGGYFQATGNISVKVLRPIAGNLVVVWASQPIAVPERGVQRLTFPVTVGVEKGDLLAYHLGSVGMVGFDTGTGDTRYLNDDVMVGASLKPSSLQGENDKRAYSMGVFGLLNSL